MTVRYVPFLTVPTMVSGEVPLGFDRMLAGGLGSSTRAMVVSQFSTVREDLIGWLAGFSAGGFSTSGFSAGSEVSGWERSDWDGLSLAVLTVEGLVLVVLLSVGAVDGRVVLLTIGVGSSLGWTMAMVTPAIAATPARLAIMRAGFGRPNFSMVSSLE